MDSFLSAKEAAKLLAVSTRTLTRWIRMGRLRPSRIGRTVRFSRRHLVMQMEQYEHGDDPGKRDDALMG